MKLKLKKRRFYISFSFEIDSLLEKKIEEWRENNGWRIYKLVGDFFQVLEVELDGFQFVFLVAIKEEWRELRNNQIYLNCVFQWFDIWRIESIFLKWNKFMINHSFSISYIPLSRNLFLMNHILDVLYLILVEDHWYVHRHSTII